MCGSQTVFCSTKDAADQAELIDIELRCLIAFFFLQQAGDGETPAVTAGSGHVGGKKKEKQQKEKEQKAKKLGFRKHYSFT